jgi:hypothetical protein
LITTMPARSARLLALAAVLLAPLALTSPAAADNAPRATHVFITAPWSSVYPNTPTHINAQLTPDDHDALEYCRTGGTMTFRDNGVPVVTLPVDQYCSAYTFMTFTPGDHAVSVEFSGNAQYLASTGTLALFAFTNQAFSGLPGGPGASPPPPAPAPDPAPVPIPDPAPAPPLTPAPPADVVPTQTVRTGLADVSGVRVRGRVLTFAQTIAAPGDLRWTLSRGDGSPPLATATATVAPGSATASIRLAAGARRWLRAHPHRRLLLRSVLTLADGRAIGASRRLAP